MHYTEKLNLTLTGRLECDGISVKVNRDGNLYLSLAEMIGRQHIQNGKIRIVILEGQDETV